MANANNPPGGTGVNQFPLVIRNMLIRQDEMGHVCLDDMHEAMKASPGRAPQFWRTQRQADRLIVELQKTVTSSSLKANESITSVIFEKRDRGNAGVWAHPVLAVAYAAYLSPMLGVEVNKTWLRARSGDATLADEILSRASDHANLWAATRATARVKRNAYTDTLYDHGVREPRGYAICTNAIYRGIHGKTAQALRRAKGISPSKNLRDAMSLDELIYTQAAEALATERIKETNPQGVDACASASLRSADFLRRAIEADRADRKKTAA